MLPGGVGNAASDEAPVAAPTGTRARPHRARLPLRPWLRAAHRDVGYVLVGLTFIYATSGLAVNHIDDFNSNYAAYERTHRVAPLRAEDDDASLADAVRAELGIEEQPSDVYRIEDGELELTFESRTLRVRLREGEVLEQGQEPRLFFRLANWLHLNRGKKAWTYIADGYAALLLMLAASGMFMLPGRKGLLGRGAVLVAIGCAVPILYVTLSGGP